jgi:hypothetical protein
MRSVPCAPGAGDAGDGVGDLTGTLDGLLNRAGHLLGGGSLLLHRAGDGCLPVGDLRDDRAGLADRGHGGGGVALDRPSRRPMSSVALTVSCASSSTSFATTAKPFPTSPARAASIVALSASRFVSSTIEVE